MLRERQFHHGGVHRVIQQVPRDVPAVQISPNLIKKGLYQSFWSFKQTSEQEEQTGVNAACTGLSVAGKLVLGDVG